MKKIALTLAVAVVCYVGVGCTTAGGIDKSMPRPAVEADGSFDGKYQRRNVGEWADADLVISGDGGSFRTFGSGCHRGGTPLIIVRQTVDSVSFKGDYQGSIVGCNNNPIARFTKVIVNGKKGLAIPKTDEVHYLMQ